MKHKVKKSVFFVMKHDHDDETELVKELNARLSDQMPHVKMVTTWIDGDLNRKFGIYMEGFVEGYDHTPFTVWVDGENHSVSTRLVNDKGTLKLFTTYEDRKTLNDFFTEKIIPMYC